MAISVWERLESSPSANVCFCSFGKHSVEFSLLCVGTLACVAVVERVLLQVMSLEALEA